MIMWVHDINPIIFSIGPLQARWYGLAYVIAFAFGYFYLRHRKAELKLKEQEIDSLALQLILGMLIGARLFAVFIWQQADWMNDPLSVFYIWNGGMALHGGIIGMVTMGYWFYYRHKDKFTPGKLADIIVIPGMVGLMIGRFANFINGEIVGIPTDLPWCIVFPNIDQICRHPVQLYAVAGRAFLVAFLFKMKSMKEWKKGFIFWTAMFLMGVGRFIVDFLREDIRYLGLSLGQYLSIALFIISGIIIWKYYIKK